MTKEIITESMLSSIAVQLLREQPGCRMAKSVEIDVTAWDWSLGLIVAPGTNPRDISYGRIIVERDMKTKYDLARRAD